MTQNSFQTLSPTETEMVKKAFIANKHPRFKKLFAVNGHKPFGTSADYVECIDHADAAKIAKLIKIFTMLVQPKVYLFHENVFCNAKTCFQAKTS